MHTGSDSKSFKALTDFLPGSGMTGYKTLSEVYPLITASFAQTGQTTAILPYLIRSSFARTSSGYHQAP